MSFREGSPKKNPEHFTLLQPQVGRSGISFLVILPDMFFCALFGLVNIMTRVLLDLS